MKWWNDSRHEDHDRHAKKGGMARRLGAFAVAAALVTTLVGTPVSAAAYALTGEDLPGAGYEQDLDPEADPAPKDTEVSAEDGEEDGGAVILPDLTDERPVAVQPGEEAPSDEDTPGTPIIYYADPDEGGDSDVDPGVDPGADIDPNGVDLRTYLKSSEVQWRKDENDTWHSWNELGGAAVGYTYGLKFRLEYTLPMDALWKNPDEPEMILFYQLPDSLKNFTGGDSVYADNKVVGEYEIMDGIVTIHFTDLEYIEQNKESGIDGVIELTGTVSQLKQGDDGKVELDFSKDVTFEMTVKPKPVDLSIEKKGIKKDVAGNKITYQVTVSTEEGTHGTPVLLHDALTIGLSGTAEVGAKYDEDSLKTSLYVKKTNKNGGKTEIEENPASDEEEANGWSVTVAADSKSFDLTLPALGAGESYTVEYSCDLEDADKLRGDFTVQNNATASAGEDDEKTKVISNEIKYTISGLIEKKGWEDQTTHEVTWQVELNKNQANLKGFVLRDFFNGVSDSQELVKWPVKFYRGTVDENGNVTYEKNATVGTLPYKFGPEDDNYVYKFEYTTPDTPRANFTENTVWNRAYLITGDPNLNMNPYSTWSVESKQGDRYQKEGTGVVENADTLTLNWKLTLDPVRTLNGWTLTDTLQDGQYLTDAQKEDLKTKLKVLPGFENGSVTFTGSSFTAEGTGKWPENQKETIEYSSTWNRNLDAVKSYTFTNKATFENYTVTGTNYYHEGTVVQKLDASTGKTETGDITNHEYHELKNGRLVWDVVITMSDKMKAADSFTITENLPDGVMLTGLAFKKGDFLSSDVTFTGDDDGSVWTAKANGMDVTAYAKGDQVTIEVPQGVYRDPNPRNKTITLEVTVTPVNVAAWTHDTTYPFRNSVTVTSSTLPEGGYTTSQEQDIFYNQNYNAIAKTGKKLDNALNQVQYQIVVNPEGLTFLDGKERLKLVDTLTRPDGMKIFLEDSRLKVYDYTDGVKGEELSPDEYAYTYEEKETENVLTFRLPDGRPLLVEYVYRGDGEVNKEFTLSNHAVLSGTSSQGTSSGSNYMMTVQSSSASVRLNGISLYKVDSSNYGKHLQGAVFRLEKWNAAEDRWETVLDEVTSDANGLLKTVDENNRNLLQTGVAYRMVELTAPHGYELRMEPFDFYIDTEPADTPADYAGQLCFTGQRVFIPDAQGYCDPQLTKDIVDNGELVKRNTAKPGETVQYQITIQVAHGQPSKYVLHDAMSGLDFDEATLKITHPVKDENGELIEQTLEENIDYTLQKDCEDSCAFEIVFSDERLVPGDLLTLTYSAVVRQDAVVEGEGNPNAAWLEYADPTGEDKTEPDETRTVVPEEPEQPSEPEQPPVIPTPIDPSEVPEEPADSDSREEQPASSAETQPEEPASSAAPEEPASSEQPASPEEDPLRPGAPSPDNRDGWVLGAHGAAGSPAPEAPADSTAPAAPMPDNHKNKVLGAADSLIQTGQLNWPIPVLLALGGALVLVGLTLTRRKNRR